MANWLSADELSRLFVVQPDTLASYSARGNLGSRMDVRGRRVFSMRQVESLFPRRGENGRRVGAALGTLGQAKLGMKEAVQIGRHSQFQEKIERRGEYQSPIQTKYLRLSKSA